AELFHLPGAGHRLVDVAAVVAGVDLDAGAVGPAAGVERLGGRLEGERLVLEGDDRRLEDRHQADHERVPAVVAGAVVPEAERLVVDRLTAAVVGAVAVAVAPRVAVTVVVAAR